MREKIPLLHCWEEDTKQVSTCLLEIDHDGPHEFTPNKDIREHIYKKFRSD